MTHPRRNLITASLRGEATDLVRVLERLPIVADRWMICSDGVSDYLPDDEIRAVLTAISDPHEAAQALVQRSLEAGSRDNVTAVVADVVEDGALARIPAVDVPAQFAGSAATRFSEDVDLAG